MTFRGCFKEQTKVPTPDGFCMNADAQIAQCQKYAFKSKSGFQLNKGTVKKIFGIPVSTFFGK